MTYFSIIIPVYNKEQTINRCLDSILFQRFHDLEIIIVDDGSKDNSMILIKQYNNPSIKIFSQPNQGPASARNLGVEKANGKWCMFLDADDELLPDSLYYLAELTTTIKDYNVFVCNYYYKKNGNATLSSHFKSGRVTNNFYEFYKNRLPMRAGSVIIKKKVLDNHPQKTVLRRYEDLESLLNIMRDEIIYRSSKPIMIYNIDNVSASNKRNNINEDFLGHLQFKGKSFWEKAFLYSLYEQAKTYYPQECKALYSHSIQHMYDIRLYFYFIHFKSKLMSILK